MTSFNKLNLNSLLLRTCQKIQYTTPTPIQKLTIPSILSGESVIANAQTGSGKTAAFGLPLIQKLSKQPSSIFALIVAPSRELAMQISQQISIFGQGVNLRMAVLIGGAQISKQIQQLQKYPHIVIGTPGRMTDMLNKSQRFREDIERVQMLILDQADRLFEQSIIDDMKKLVKAAKNVNQIVLATATIDENFEGKRLQSLLQTDVKFIKYSTYDGIKTVGSANLTQYYIFTPQELKPGYLLSLLEQNTVYKIIIFVKTCKEATLMAQTLKSLKYKAVALHSFMKLNQRIANLGMFRTDQANILVTTDLTSRGLDIPNVNFVINYHMPRKVSDYVHRVGRTARNGFEGESISFVTQYQQELFLEIEKQINVKIMEYKISEKLELVSQYNRVRREVKIQLMSSGVLGELDKKSMNKKEKKMEIRSIKMRKVEEGAEDEN